MRSDDILGCLYYLLEMVACVGRWSPVLRRRQAERGITADRRPTQAMKWTNEK